MNNTLPHCDREGTLSSKKKLKVDEILETVDLGDGKARLAYDAELAKTLKDKNVHQGQRKLLLSEIQLLTEHYKKKSAKDPIVAYVGSAPGTHLLFLHALFPRVQFILWDGAPFDPALTTKKEVFELRNEFFDERTCAVLKKRMSTKEAKKRPLLFVSDIRSASPHSATFEVQVMHDLLSQKRWTELLRPAMALLKFRLPYTLEDGDVFKYLRGKLFYGIWPTHQSGETRLLVTPDDLGNDIEYDFTSYEQVMFHHNAITRRTCIAPDRIPDEFKSLVGRGLYCTCFDCLSELSVYARYLKHAAMNAGGPFETLDAVVTAYADDTRRHGVGSVHADEGDQD